MSREIDVVDISDNGLGKTVPIGSLIFKFNGFVKCKIVEDKDKEDELRFVLSKTNYKRYAFLVNEVIRNRGITSKSYQLCSTALANKYHVHFSTVSGWIKELIKLGILRVTRRTFKKGHFSKAYQVCKSLLDYINNFNGYNKKFPKTAKKKEIRDWRLSRFDSLTYEMRNAVYLASAYLGCPESYMGMVRQKIPSTVLRMPRENHVLESKHWDFFHAYNIAARQYNRNHSKKFKRIKELDWVREFSHEFSHNLAENGSPTDIKRVMLPYKNHLVNRKIELSTRRQESSRVDYLLKAFRATYNFLTKGKYDPADGHQGRMVANLLYDKWDRVSNAEYQY